MVRACSCFVVGQLESGQLVVGVEAAECITPLVRSIFKAMGWMSLLPPLGSMMVDAIK